MVDIDYFEIDNKEYMITDEIEDNGFIYYYLCNIDSKEDVMIRKAKKDDLNTLLPIDDDDELKKAVDLIINK